MSHSALNRLVTVIAVISSLRFFISSFLMSSSLGCQVAELWALFRRFERCSQTANQHFYLLWESCESQDLHKMVVVILALSEKTCHTCHPRNLAVTGLSRPGLSLVTKERLMRATRPQPEIPKSREEQQRCRETGWIKFTKLIAELRSQSGL